MKKAVAYYSWKRIGRSILLRLQSSNFIPSKLRLKIVKLGGVNVGRPCFLGSGIGFDTLRPDLISIGEGCCITSGVKIISHFLDPDEDIMYYAPVEIGKHVFIGVNSVIVHSVKIGDRAVIGAGSVVLKSIGKNEIWAGNPAKFIRMRRDR